MTMTLPVAKRAGRCARLALLGGPLMSACIPLGGARYWDSRPVLAKEGATTLISTQGARCDVATLDAAKVVIGQKHRCVWQEQVPGRGPDRVQR